MATQPTEISSVLLDPFREIEVGREIAEESDPVSAVQFDPNHNYLSRGEGHRAEHEMDLPGARCDPSTTG
jgi:hypothetical protein